MAGKGFRIDADLNLSRPQWHLFLGTLPMIVLIRLGTFCWFHLSEGLWRYVSMRDMRNTQGVPDCGMRNAE